MPPTRKPRSRIGEINSGRILDAALGVFAHHGFSGSRLDEIAAAAGMSKPNLLYYFRSKDALYRAVLTRTLELWLEPLRELDPNGDPRAAFSHYIRRKLAYSRSHPDGSRLFAIEIMQGAPHLAHVLSGELAVLFDLKCKLIRRWIAEGRLSDIDPHHVLFAIWATTQHYADFAAQIRTLTGKDFNDEAFFENAARAIETILLEGLLPRP